MPLSRLPKLSLLFFTLLTLAGCSISHVLRVEDHQVIAVDTMLDELQGIPVILVGERHDAPSHHRLQLDIIKRVRQGRKPVVIGMEMFEAPSQRALDAWTSGKVPEAAFRKLFEWSWRNLPWGLYAGILCYARDHQIPIVALNAPRDLVEKVSQHGVASLSGRDLGQLPPGMELEVSDAYLDFMRSSYFSHGRNGDAFRNICQAQMLRNRFMARRVSDYLRLHPESTMVVLAGGGHAREEGGIPAELGGVPYKIVLPALPGLGPETVSKKDGDYLLEEPYLWLELLF